MQRPLPTPCPRQLFPLSALVVALTVSACSPTEPVAVTETVRPVYVAVARSSADAELSFVGEVRAARRAELAFPVAGRVSAVLAEVGDSVRQGQVLAQLDEQPLQAQLAAANADEQRARAQVHETRQRLERLRQARQANAVSAGEWGGAELELATAEAALNAALAQREQATWSLANARLRAPMNGVVALRSIERGQAAGPGAPALVLDGAGRELATHVPGALALKVGQAVSLQGAGQTHMSRVLRMAGRLDAGGVRQVWLAVPDAAAVGSTWSVALQGKQDNAAASAVQVPLRSVTPNKVSGSGTILRLKADTNTLETAEVALGAVRGEWVEVRQGVREGDRVVVAGALALQAGMKVQPVMVQR